MKKLHSAAMRRRDHKPVEWDVRQEKTGQALRDEVEARTKAVRRGQARERVFVAEVLDQVAVFPVLDLRVRQRSARAYRSAIADWIGGTLSEIGVGGEPDGKEFKRGGILLNVGAASTGDAVRILREHFSRVFGPTSRVTN